ncbi:hypothetical protein GCM10007939_10070 [Amylibacter marinus]|uniref:Tetratricopeptide repeat-like domain-containing protein n=1 Tax=Amylibacter marinus TaxID=1475483 RepID=A0ABQ5VU84_9RHOB|nr:hypothetical protein [Amylibacter marinus]GLQ34724.1 hypothetical protein GCM10007939_10070 [Amylibacter marinus]
MSNTESFIDEVSEEVRKDQLFALYKKYGWIAGAVIALIVGGAGYLEWDKSRKQTVAQQRGDGLVAALDLETPEARSAGLAEIVSHKGGEATLASLLQAAVLLEQDDEAAALEIYDRLASGDDPIYAQISSLKALMIRGSDISAEERLAALDLLAAPEAPFRNLALEQKAIALLDAGRQDEGIAALVNLLDEPLITANQQNRVQQMIVALGGELPSRASLVPTTEHDQ